MVIALFNKAGKWQTKAGDKVALIELENPEVRVATIGLVFEKSDRDDLVDKFKLSSVTNNK